MRKIQSDYNLTEAKKDMQNNIGGKTMNRFKSYIRRTWKNKVVALTMDIIGAIPMILDGDATAFVGMLILTFPLFFEKKNYIDF